MHCAFDAYGTLFDVAAAARLAAGEPGSGQLADSWQAVVADWRARQLRYSWLRAVTGDHADFWQVTIDSLDWALEASGLSGDAGLRDRLLDIYWRLPAYGEVVPVLSELERNGHKVAILSNGSPDMLDAAVSAAGIGNLVDAVLSVETVGVFKPHHSVYELVTGHFGCGKPGVLFVSSNGWDAAAASGFGFRTVWVNRSGEPEERLPWKAWRTVGDLTRIPELASST